MISRGRSRQERRERDLLAAARLLDAFQVDPQPRLQPERRRDRLREGHGRAGGLVSRRPILLRWLRGGLASPGWALS